MTGNSIIFLILYDISGNIWIKVLDRKWSLEGLGKILPTL
jgi:hypothetical protein